MMRDKPDILRNKLEMRKDDLECLETEIKQQIVELNSDIRFQEGRKARVNAEIHFLLAVLPLLKEEDE
jgi:hypothetical protein